jgi:hypothetical protein
MLWAVWAGVAIAVLAVGFGGYRAVRQLLALLRSLRRLKAESTQALESLTQATERLAEHTPDPAGRLQPALDRLARDRARLDVLLAAVEDVRGSVGRITAVYPRK